MSQRRKVALGNLDLKALKESATRRGRSVSEFSDVSLYKTVERADLVIDDSIGFSESTDGVSVVYDDMSTSLYADIMADYFEDLGEVRGYSHYHVVGRKDTYNKITVSVEGY